jgi:hypothetical protein
VLPFPFDQPVTFAVATAVQENVVPATFFGSAVMAMLAVSPLHIVTLEAVAEGSGFTVTTRSTGNPLHPLKLGVILYVTIPEAFPVFTGASVILPAPFVVTEAGSIGPVIELVHVNVVPPIVAVGLNASDSPLQIC